MANDSLSVEAPQIREDLKNLLRFAEQLLAVRDKVVLDIGEYPIHLTESDLLDEGATPLPGIAFGSSEDVWLSFGRLQERRPPQPPPNLDPWLRRDARPSPTQAPTLLAERVVQVTAEEATDLIEAGFADTDGIAALPSKPGEVGEWAVPLRPAEMPEIAQALGAYIEGPWQAWAADEAPRRRAIRLYEVLYKAQAQIAATGGEGGLELVIGIGLARWSHGGGRINLALIEQRAECDLDESSGALAILPRNVPPVPVLSPFLELGIPGVADLQREMTQRLERIARDPDVPFGPFQPASFRGVLEACAARLDASGRVLAPEEEFAPAGEALRISPTFCVLVRTRRDDIIRDDLRRLADTLIDNSKPLPETARRFVTAPADAVPDDVDPVDLEALLAASIESAKGRGADTEREQSGKSPSWLFFPLSANEEQEEIARRLDQKDVHGVVVQGPPGTGKTHTIANIIGHSMAMGRRVLVSAHTAEALTAIRDKLPPELSALAIAVTHSDREGARQLEQAVSALADRVQSINSRETKRRAEDLLRSIEQADARVAEIDAELARIARANLTELPWRGGTALPEAIAVWVATQGGQHAWFPDPLDLIPQHEPLVGEAEIAELRALRRRLGADIRYRADELLPGSDALPGIGTIVLAHRTLRGAEERREKERNGSLPPPDLSVAKPGELVNLLGWLERLAAWRDARPDHPWMSAAWETLASGRPTRRFTTEGLRPMLEEAALLAQEGETLALLALELPETADADRVAVALSNLSAGRKPFGPFGAFRGSPVKAALESARIAGEPPHDAQGWANLAKLHAWRRAVRGFVARWNAFAAQHELTRLPEDPIAARQALGQLGGSAFEMLTLVAHAQTHLDRVSALFPYGLQAVAVVLRLELSVAIASLRANVGHAELAEAERLRDSLGEIGNQVGGELREAFQQMAEGLGTLGIEDAEVAAKWQEIQAEVDRLGKLRTDLGRLSTLSSLIRKSGASRWAAQIDQQIPSADDAILPVNWRDAWDHARAAGFLSRIANRTAVQQLTQARAELLDVRQRRFLEVIELLTYLGLRGRLTENVQAALRQFLAALARLPKTPGARTAARQRRILRDSLDRAAKAIPCWIMPEWRVAEQLPPELGTFDLVIIDEASQSNIMALPVVLRGKKLLIVGDDRQVSPVAVGTEDAAVNRLRVIYLRGQPLAEQIDPATSLYELGGMMYPGKVIVLREHFRCVEPIIRFSSRFYGGRLVPLRLPTPSERIDPPLVDILVSDGKRRGDVNDNEATVIVEEIKRTINDPLLNASAKRTIGVISLHSDKQAKLIYDRLIQAIGPQALSGHRIMCGDAATFQGQERDIVFLSMVHDENTAAKQSSQLYEQRYNVALSRARDRMVLVRSVTPSMLKDGDIKLEVLRHFQDPTAGGRIDQSDDILSVCESRFERAVGERLLKSGYRLRAQVPAGGYRIDFVVEGADDRRLAVELDGDSFHGPERWAEDVKRQRALERVGWTFWRCWASEWEADKDAAFRDLVETLRKRGIEPIGAAGSTDAALVEFREVRQPTQAGELLRGFAETEYVPPAAAPDGEALDQRHGTTDRKVKIGDVVVVRYADGNARSLTVRIVADGSADGRRRIAPTSPLAAAIVGRRTEEETEVVISGRLRTVVVEEIRDAGTAADP